MTQEIIDNLTKENTELKGQLHQNSVGVQNLLAQHNAAKAMINDANNVVMQLKANMSLMENHIANLSAQLKSATDRVSQLESEKGQTSVIPE